MHATAPAARRTASPGTRSGRERQRVWKQIQKATGWTDATLKLPPTQDARATLNPQPAEAVTFRTLLGDLVAAWAQKAETAAVRSNTLPRYLYFLVAHAQAAGAHPDVIATLRAEARTANLRGRHTGQARWVLAVVDPLPWLTLRNAVVGALRGRQDRLDDVVRHTLRFYRAPGFGAKGQQSRLHVFGERDLRPWLELAVRFTNAPLGFAATRNLWLARQVPPDPDAKRVWLVPEPQGTLQRAWELRSGGRAVFSLGQTLSCYAWFYLTYCHPDGMGPPAAERRVFLGTRGAAWVRTAEDAWAYLTGTLGVTPDEALMRDRTLAFDSQTVSFAAASVENQPHGWLDFPAVHRWAQLLDSRFAQDDQFALNWQEFSQAVQAQHTFARTFRLEPLLGLLEHADAAVPLAGLRRPPRDVVEALTGEMMTYLHGVPMHAAVAE